MESMLSTQVLVVIALAAFVAVLGVFYALRTFLNPERTAQDRLQEFTGGTTGRRGVAGDDLFQSGESVFSVAQNLGRLAVPTDIDQSNLLRRRLLQAGYRSRNNLEMYAGLRSILAIGLPVLIAAFLLLVKPDIKPIALGLWAVVGAAAGYYVPALWVENRLQKRQAALLKPFPDALDLLVSSVEAGLGLDAAFRRVAKEIETAAPELAAELQAVNTEVNAGVPRLEALRRLDERTGLPEVNSLVNVLTQAERFGTSVARSLRVHSDMVRTKRMLAAEERAAKISPKLTVVMILFILPCLFIVLIGPAIIRVIRILLPTLAGA